MARRCAIVAYQGQVDFADRRSLDEDPSRELRYAGGTVPTQPALFLALDEVTVRPQRLGRRRPQLPRSDKPLRSGSGLADFDAFGLPADLTIQIFADLDMTLGPLDHRVVAFSSDASGDEPYDLNLFRNTSRDHEQHLGYVPMARMGGFPVPDLRVWTAEAESALGCTVRDIVVLYGGGCTIGCRTLSRPRSPSQSQCSRAGCSLCGGTVSRR